MFAPDDPKDKFDHNRVYKKNDSDMDSSLSHRGDASLDFVQGSTYPFARTLFGSLREGFLEAMPRKIDHRVDLAFGWKLNTDFTSHWEDDTLYQSNSTFIPTVSAMDLKCGGNLAIGEPCAFSESYKGFPFESPKERSSADAAYAVDVTHPRFNEAMSGRHIELPGKYGNLDTLVLRGMQVDIWRLLCEVAKNNYDSATQSYRNPNLDGVFVPGGSCMDLSKMPDLIKKSGLTQWSRFGFSRYDYDQAATESDDVVRFNVPAGWHKVGLFNMGKEIPEGSTFEVDVRANGAPGSWVKMELLLTITNTGVGQVQLQEIEVPADGKVHTVRWTVPSAQGSLKNYRWFRLVANSSGVEMDVAAPRLIYARSFQMALEKLSEGILYPGNTFPVRNSSGEILINPYTDALGSGMELLLSAIGTNGFVDLNGEKDLSKFSNLKVTYWPGTCQGTRVYFDSYPSGAKRLEIGSVSGNFLVKTIPLKDIINTDFTQEQGLSGAKLFLRASSVGERCVVNKIELE